MASHSILRTLVAATMGVLALSVPASAGGYPSVHGYGHGHGGGHSGLGQPGWGHSGGYGNPGHYLPPPDGWHDHERPRYPGHRIRGLCEPHEAVEKARDFGLRRIGIERVTRHEIVVSGRTYGHRALLVFDRYSRHCRVIATRGL